MCGSYRHPCFCKWRRKTVDIAYFTGITFQAVCGLRLAFSAACGFAIGFERKNRLKEAGMRTHMIVAIGAAMMMIVSKYGFFDLVGVSDFLRADVSRIAAQIVSGVGFLGAGMIFIRNRSVTGLTTAAGIWTTAGIGMAVGAGMYSLGVVGTLLVLLIQYWMHNPSWWNLPDVCSITVRVNEEKGNVGDVMRVIQEAGAQPADVAVTHKKNGLIKLDVRVRLPAGIQQYQVIEALEKSSCIAEVED